QACHARLFFGSGPFGFGGFTVGDGFGSGVGLCSGGLGDAEGSDVGVTDSCGSATVGELAMGLGEISAIELAAGVASFLFDRFHTPKPRTATTTSRHTTAGILREPLAWPPVKVESD